MRQELNLTTVLGWGYLDVAFLERKLEEFDVDTDDVIDRIESFGGDKTDINNWIRSTFELAAYNFLDKVQDYANENEIEFDKDEIEVEVFCNYLDSFLNGKDLNHEIDITDFSDGNLQRYLDWRAER